ncbi:hypothetical protein ACPZ19_10780 [Amycolatopsis lurida]
MRAWLTMVAVLLLSACGAEPPAPVPPPPAPEAVNPEAAAEWAVRTLDPCALLDGPVISWTPHSCELRQEKNGQYLTVRVGGEITHFARYRSTVIEENGLRVYLSYRLGGAGLPASCQFGIPLSPTRAIWVTAAWARDSDYEQKCAAARPIVGEVTGKLRGGPAALRTGQGALLKWTACELLTELGPPPVDDPVWQRNSELTRTMRVGDPSMADYCEWGDYLYSGIQLDFRVGTVPNEGEVVQLGDVPARRQDNGPSSCALSWAQDTRPDGTANLATLRGAGCDRVTDAATKLRARLAGPAPATPPAPAELGFSADEPDLPGDAVCVISALPVPGCRAHVPQPVPAGGEAIMRQAATETGLDLACTLLADAIKAATGQDGQVAHTPEQCIGTTADRSVDFEFKFDTAEKPHTWDGPRFDIGGFPAVALNQGGSRGLKLSDTRGVDRTGRLHLNATAVQPRGVDDFDSVKDPARLTLADRVAEALMTHF